MDTQKLSKEIVELEYAINSLIDNFNAGAQLSDDDIIALGLYSSKLEMFSGDLYRYIF